MKKKPIKKYLKRAFHIVTRSIEALLAFVFVLGIMFFFRLTQGPIEIESLAPILEQVLTREGDLKKVSLKSVYLELDTRHKHLFAIKATDIVVTNEDDIVLMNIPEAHFAFNLLPVLRGNFIPSSVELAHPYWFVRVETEAPVEDKAVSEGFIQTIGSLFKKINELDYFGIEAGRLIMDMPALEKQVTIPDLNFSIERKATHMLDFSGGITLYEEENVIPFNWRGFYYTNTNLMLVDAGFKDLPLEQLGAFANQVNGMNLVLNGSFSAILSMNEKELTGIVKQLDFSAELARKGTLYLPEPIDTTYQVESLVMSGSFLPGLKGFEIVDAVVNLGEPTAFVNFRLENLDTFLNTGDLSVLNAVLSTQVRDLSLDELPSLWPSKLGTPAYDWVKANMHRGNISDSYFTFYFKGTDIVDLKGILSLSGATINYVDGLPPVEEAAGTVSFFMDKILIEATQGHVKNIDVAKVNVSFLDLDKDEIQTLITFSCKGPLNEALDILETEPLALTNFLGLDTKKMKGIALPEVSLSFPIGKGDFDPQKIKVQVSADLKDVSGPVPFVNLLLEKGNVSLFVDNEGISARGNVSLDNHPFDVEWKHSFNGNVKKQGEGSLTGQLSEEILKPYYSDVGKVMKGPVAVRASVVFENLEKQQITLHADLTNAELNLFPISYMKKALSPASFSMKMNTGKSFEITSLNFEAPSEKVHIEGKADFNNQILLDFKRIETPENDTSLFLQKNKNNLKVSAIGKRMNVVKWLYPKKETEENEKTEKSEEKAKTEKGKNNLDKFNFDIRVDLDELYLSEKEPLKDIHLKIAKQNGVYTKWEGSVTAAEPLILSIGKKKELLLATKDFGSFLSRTGVSDRIKGGQLRAKMTQEKGALEGKIEMKEYALSDASFFMQAATILGILDAFGGNKIAFKKATIPFRIENNFDIKITEGVAYGTALGITFQGDFSDSEITMTGSVIPAYAINSLPGKIPLVGRLFAADKGGGLIGLSFDVKGPLNDLKVDFNPSSLLTPGIIRNIFD